MVKMTNLKFMELSKIQDGFLADDVLEVHITQWDIYDKQIWRYDTQVKQKCMIIWRDDGIIRNKQVYGIEIIEMVYLADIYHFGWLMSMKLKHTSST
ncbi:hypothetical protein GUJ93_ZPchr0011g28679 [Zizania palustris]|uniref:Uncharacterized protein n=1 Tax=Zizania palustris TaxID=103762 RepID=A0A8J5WH98_ZIZPA|nr:hypothetical protein GUJ93_ZPchr0011g28679 [Zizania palustris]